MKDERLSRPEPTQVKDLPRVATEVPAIPGVSWLSRPSAPLGTVSVNNLPTVVKQWPASSVDSNLCLSNTCWMRYPLGHQRCHLSATQTSDNNHQQLYDATQLLLVANRLLLLDITTISSKSIISSEKRQLFGKWLQSIFQLNTSNSNSGR